MAVKEKRHGGVDVRLMTALQVLQVLAVQRSSQDKRRSWSRRCYPTSASRTRSTRGLSVIVTLPPGGAAAAVPQGREQETRLLHHRGTEPAAVRVLNQEPLELEAGDALVFEADSLCHGGAGLGPNEDMACALFAYVGAVTKPVVTRLGPALGGAGCDIWRFRDLLGP